MNSLENDIEYCEELIQKIEHLLTRVQRDQLSRLQSKLRYLKLDAVLGDIVKDYGELLLTSSSARVREYAEQKTAELSEEDQGAT